MRRFSPYVDEKSGTHVHREVFSGHIPES